MANKQIKDYANLALADTDSLIKQSVTGLTARTTVADIKDNLDGRYTQKGTVIWEDENGASSIYPLSLTVGKNYEIYTNSRCVITELGEKEFFGRQSKTILITNYEPPYPVLVYVEDYFETAIFYASRSRLHIPTSSDKIRIYKIVESEV